MYTIYSKANCSFCKKAKEILDTRDLPYVEVDLACHPDKLEELRQLGCKTVPQIFVDDGDANTAHIGGYDDLIEYLQN